jgi:hypothetical protein
MKITEPFPTCRLNHVLWAHPELRRQVGMAQSLRMSIDGKNPVTPEGLPPEVAGIQKYPNAYSA